MSTFRYPGTKPFAPGQERVFFGRERDTTDLLERIQLDHITVLFGQSGVGKTSMINAGLLPLLSAKTNLESLRIRLYPQRPNTNGSQAPIEETPSESPAESVSAAIQGHFELTAEGSLMEYLVPGDQSIWKWVKLAQFQGEKTVLLIFDQVEQLFRRSALDILQFKQELAEALSHDIPQRYLDALEEGLESEDPRITRAEIATLQEPPELKVLFGVRSDRVHLLDKLSDYLPGIRRNRKELLPLSREQARTAIVAPAQLEGDFSSRPFTYEQPALEAMLDYLTKEGEVEVATTQLQILCSRLEQAVIQTEAKSAITPADVADIESMIESYYDDQIAAIPEESQQLAARRLIEEGLIFEDEERRLTVYEGQILQTFQVRPATLDRLVAGHLIRSEPSPRSGFVYELSHDTLVAPILDAKRERVAREAAAEQAALLRAERKKRRSAVALAAAFLLLTVFLLVSLLATRRARRQLGINAFEYSRSLAQQLKLQGDYASSQSIYNEALSFDQYVDANRIDSVERELRLVQRVERLVGQANALRESGDLVGSRGIFLTADSIGRDTLIAGRLRTLEVQLEDAFQELQNKAFVYLSVTPPQLDTAILLLDSALQIYPDDQALRQRLERLRTQRNGQ